jgi:hypothetical protein
MNYVHCVSSEQLGQLNCLTAWISFWKLSHTLHVMEYQSISMYVELDVLRKWLSLSLCGFTFTLSTFRIDTITLWNQHTDINIAMIQGCDYRRGMDWWMYLLESYTQHSELQVITTLSLISTLYKSPQHLLSLFPACCVISRFLLTASNSGDSSTSRAQVLSSQLPV